jgi:hypothetical protein
MFAIGFVVVVVVRSSSNQLSIDLGVVSVFAIPAGWLAAAIGAAAWLWRARINAAVLSAACHRLSADWAVFGWFLPVAHVVVPLVMIADVVRAGAPAGPSIATVRWWSGSWAAGSVLLPACAAIFVYRPWIFATLVVLAAAMLVVAAACFTRLTLAVAAAQDAALR